MSSQVDALEIDDAVVLPERPEELAMTGVYGVDTRSAGLEQHAGEAAGRSADVEREAPAHRHVERGERGAQLRLAAKRTLHPDDDRGPHGYERGGVGDDAAVHEDSALGDQPLGPIEVWMRPRELGVEPAQATTGLPAQGLLLVRRL